MLNVNEFWASSGRVLDRLILTLGSRAPLAPLTRPSLGHHNPITSPNRSIGQSVLNAFNEQRSALPVVLTGDTSWTIERKKHRCADTMATGCRISPVAIAKSSVWAGIGLRFPT